MTAITHIPDTPPKPRPCGYEWRTESVLFGLPLIHVAVGRNKEGRRLVAKGIIGIGQYAMGFICISQFGIGLFAVAQFSVALASVSQFAVAVYTLAQIGISFDGVGQVLLRIKDLLR